MQAFAQIRIGGAQHACACVRLDAFNGCFRGEPCGHRFLQPMHPAAVICKHAIGFQHLAVLAAIDRFAPLQEQIEIGAHGLDGSLQALELFWNIIGNEIGDNDARLVQHNVTQRDSVVEGQAWELKWSASSGFRTGPRDGRELSRGDHLGEHHRRRLQRFFLLLSVCAASPILYDEYA